MKELVHAFIWISITAFIGFSIIVFFDRKRLIGTLESIGLSFPLGIGVVSIEMFILGLFGMRFNIGLILIPWIMLIIYNFIFLYKLTI